MYQNTQDTDHAVYVYVCVFVCVCVCNLYVFFIAYDSPSLAFWLYFLGWEGCSGIRAGIQGPVRDSGRDIHDC